VKFWFHHSESDSVWSEDFESEDEACSAYSGEVYVMTESEYEEWRNKK
jgi:hypothetical protein